MKDQIKQVLDNVLPAGAYRYVSQYKSPFGSGEYVKIMFAASDYEINRVKGQNPQLVSLSLSLDKMELNVQHYAGCGGRHVYLVPDKDDPKERYLAMASRKIAFRKPKAEEKNILGAVERFAQNWIDTLKENRARLMYQDIVNYDNLLK